MAARSSAAQGLAAASAARGLCRPALQHRTTQRSRLLPAGGIPAGGNGAGHGKRANHVLAAAAASSAEQERTLGAAVLVPVEFDIRTLPLTIVIGKNPKQTTAFTAIKLLLSKKIPGLQEAEHYWSARALEALLYRGFTKVDGNRFRFDPVPLHVAEGVLIDLLPSGSNYANGSGLWETVTQTKACSPFVLRGEVDGVAHVMLRLDALVSPAEAAQTTERLQKQQAAAVQKKQQAARAGSSGGRARLAAVRAASGDSLPPARLVTSDAEAEAAVAVLLAAPEVAVDCEGSQGLNRASPISLVQLYAPEAGGSAAACCFVFDLLAMPDAERAGAMRHLQRLLESQDVVKVLHDCRSDCEALFYQWGIRCAEVWDTQVAYGVLQLLSSLAGPNASSQPTGLAGVLRYCGLPPNPHKAEVGGRMDREPQLLIERPLDPQVLEYAVADVWQLPAAKACLEAELGPAAAQSVAAFSRAYTEWDLDPADRSCGSGAGEGAGSYVGAARLVPGQDMQLTIEAPGYRPRYDLLPGEVDDAGLAESAPVPAAAAASDPDTHSLLQLFPPHVADAIREALAAEEAAAAAAAAAAGEGEGEGGSEGGLAGRGMEPVQLVEVVVDDGRPLKLRLSSGGREVALPHVDLSVEEALGHLAAAKNRLHLAGGGGGDLFYDDNRAGVPGTLHRISALRDRSGGVAGLTYRVGRHVPGVGALLLDVLAALADWRGAEGHEVQDAVSPSLLLLGAPGAGKTTLLRDFTATLADVFKRKVVVVDTSNEVAGDAREAHPCIGGARRMVVPHHSQQHAVMREAVQNMFPDVIVVDEIGSAREVDAAKSIVHRGVVLVGTAHGRTLQALMRNSDLNGLIGGVAQVTLGDENAAATNKGVKTCTERHSDPPFATVVEVLGRSRCRVHMSAARSVDALLAGRQPVTQLRWVDSAGRMMVRLEAAPEGSHAARSGSMRAAVGEAAHRLGDRGAWMQRLLALAAQYGE